MSFEGRWGLPSGTSFDTDAFLEKHQQWSHLKGYIKSFPVRSWNVITIGERDIS
jgi:hypothetical protein